MTQTLLAETAYVSGRNPDSNCLYFEYLTFPFSKQFLLRKVEWESQYYLALRFIVRIKWGNINKKIKHNSACCMVSDP